MSQEQKPCPPIYPARLYDGVGGSIFRKEPLQIQPHYVKGKKERKKKEKYGGILLGNFCTRVKPMSPIGRV